LAVKIKYKNSTIPDGNAKKYFNSKNLLLFGLILYFYTLKKSNPMSKKILFAFELIVVAAFIIVVAGCEQDKKPTKSSMEGVWTVTHVYDDNGVDHASKLNFPITAFSLSSDNTIVSTAGPLVMFLVYGDNKYTQIASDVDQVFNYAGLDFNGGEYFVAGGTPDRFTLEMKLEGLPGQKTLTTLLDMLGITQDYLDLVIYHKFMDVGIDFADDYKTMTWYIDNTTTAVYNTKDNNGNYILWGGWPVDNFTHCSIVLEKQVKDLTQVVQDAI
jgi:hypothetical protein